MKFILGHPLLVAAAVLILPLWMKIRNRLEPAAEKMWFRQPGAAYAMGFGLTLFYAAFYLARPSYYVLFHGGACGDPYFLVLNALLDPNYFHAKHLFFPTVPAQILKLALKFGIYDPLDLMYFEKAYLFFSLPNRLAALPGALMMFWLLRRLRYTTNCALLGVAFLAATFGYWFWAIQSNSMGFLLPFILLAFGITWTALARRSVGLSFLSGVMLAGCVYVHISSVFIAAGLAAFASGVYLYQDVFRSGSRSWARLIALGLGILIMALIFWILAGRWVGSMSPSRIILGLSESDRWSALHFDFRTLGIALKQAISTSLLLLLGFLQIPRIHRWETVLIALQLGLLLALAASCFTRRWDSLQQGTRGLAFGMALTAYGVAAIGYSVFPKWSFPQYYASVTPVIVLLLLLLVLPESEDQTPASNGWLLLALTAGMISTNGFSTSRIFQDSPMGDAVYRRLQAIREVAGSRHVIYYGADRDYYWNQDQISAYYAHSPKFSNITWREPMAWTDVLIKAKQSPILLLLSADDYPDTTPLVQSGISFRSCRARSDNAPLFYSIP